jgi:hypothetical protein
MLNAKRKDKIETVAKERKHEFDAKEEKYQ